MIIQDNIGCCSFECIGKSRALCLDYGDKRIGVALSDIGWNIASPLVVLDSHGVFPKLLKIIEENKVGVIVVGAPQSLAGGSSGKQHEKVKKFTEKLDELAKDIIIVFWDERYSSVAATRALVEAEMTHAKKKQYIDKVAASFILQGFLNYVVFSRRNS